MSLSRAREFRPPSEALDTAAARLRRDQRHNSVMPGSIMLYHLHRTDGKAPIKLYIRLVGKNGERAMVRVGGGWEDLAEFLKRYVAHHKSRYFFL